MRGRMSPFPPHVAHRLSVARPLPHTALAMSRAAAPATIPMIAAGTLIAWMMMMPARALPSDAPTLWLELTQVVAEFWRCSPPAWWAAK